LKYANIRISDEIHRIIRSSRNKDNKLTRARFHHEKPPNVTGEISSVPRRTDSPGEPFR